jgi:hypothetical protein
MVLLSALMEKTIFSIANDDGAPGGGGGGTVLLDVGTIASALTVEVMGGDGGNVDNSLDGVNCAGPGGGGSGGFVVDEQWCVACWYYINC